MIHRTIWGAVGGIVLACTASSLHADLNQQQFVEAIGLLGLDPDTFAASGVSEADLVNAFETIADADSSWEQVVTLRDTLRAALDAIATGGEGDVMDAVNVARTAFNQSVSNWRDSIVATVPSSVRSKLLQITAQSSSGLPAYLLVKPWTADDVSVLSKGIAEHRRQQRTGETDESPALEFYLNAMSDGDVIAAKANWDARRSAYTQRFTERLIMLD